MEKRQRCIYTPMGQKIADCGMSQKQLAQTLGLTQQSISGKLTGKIAIALDDLQKLATAFELPVFYFFLPEEFTPEYARALEISLSKLPESMYAQLIRVCSLPEKMQEHVATLIKHTVDMHDEVYFKGLEPLDQEFPRHPNYRVPPSARTRH